jgi:UDP-glucose 4-epimerase
MSTKRALVTGAGGFVGACLTRRLLEDGHRVEVLLRPGSDRWRLAEIDADIVVHEADLRDGAAVHRAVAASGPDWVFHLAAHGAYSWQTDAEGIFTSNVLGTVHLSEACVDRGFEAFVQAGSSSEYGLQDHAPSERELPEPNSLYAVAKASSTLLCGHLAARHGLKMTTLRLYSVFGPWEDPRRLMPTLIARGLRGELPPLVDPDTARDFLHVDDVSDAFLLAAVAPAAKVSTVYNVGSGIQTTIKEVVETAREVLEIGELPDWGSHEPRDWDTTVWLADPGRIKRELGWQPRRDLHSGLEQLAEWLRDRTTLWTRYRVASEANG